MKCPACQRRRLEHAKDRVTGAEVSDDGRSLLRCGACGEVLIVDAKRLRSLKGIVERPGLLWWIGGAAGLLFSIAESMVRWAGTEPDGFAGRYVMVFVFAWILLGLVKVIAEQMRAFKESENAREKFEMAFGTLLILAFAGFMAWLAARVYLEHRADQRRFSPPPAAVSRVNTPGPGGDGILPACPTWPCCSPSRTGSPC